MIRILKPLIFLSIALFFALTLRTYNINARPLQSDEGVNYYFIRELRDGHSSNYSTSQFHGPVYFSITRFFADIAAVKICPQSSAECFSDNELGIRLSSIIAGVLLVATPWILIGLVELDCIVFISFLFAVSPLLVFYSRTAIHESCFLTLSVALGVLVYRVILRQEYILILLISAVASMLVGIKETCWILFFSLLIAAGLQPYRETVKSKKLLLYLLAALILFLGMTSWFFGWGFNALILPLKGLLKWTSKGITGESQTKEWSYFFKLLWRNDPFSLMALGSAAVAAFATKSFSVRYFSLWTLVSLTIYTVLPYKTAWLAINFIAPALIVISLSIRNAFQNSHLRNAIFSLSLVVCLFMSAKQVVVTERDFSNLLYRTDTYDEIRDISALLEKSCSVVGPECRVYIGFQYYWPLPFYLQAIYKQIAYDQNLSFSDVRELVDVMILPAEQNFLHPGWRKREFRLSPIQVVQVLTK